MNDGVRSTLCIAGCLLAALGVAGPCRAQSTSASPAPDSGYFDTWFDRVDQTQGEQPHWITPLATTTPRLEEEFRYDYIRMPKVDGTTTENYGFSKGIEFIPAKKIEVILGLPAYVVHNEPNESDGFGDISMLIKYRVVASNEQHGNYILTLFFGASFPTGSAKNGAKDTILTPTIAYGKGFGDFDLQGTLGVALPTGDATKTGRNVLLNNTVQYRVFRKLWPEVEFNSTFFHNGEHDGETQNFVTPGLVAGRLPLVSRLGLTFGAGVQIATTRFHTYDHAPIFSLRLPF